MRMNQNYQMAPASSSSNGKVFGKPLQGLYAKFIKEKGVPCQPDLIREFCHSLSEQGLHYHPRTIKRQLLGNIEYIPEALEKIMVHWIQVQSKLSYQRLLREFKKNKKDLENSHDQTLYVSPQFFTRMGDGYFYLHKQLSRRQLALKLQEALKKKKVIIGLETLQAALAGKNQKIRKVLEDEMKQFFFQEGFETKDKIEKFLEEIQQKGFQEFEKVEVNNIEEIIDAYLLKSLGLSKRQLALKIKDRLEKKGYTYHLSSIQSVIEGKTRKTKRAILDIIHDLLKEEGIDNPENMHDYLNSLSESQRHWHCYVSADSIPNIVQKLLDQNPTLTRRRLALILQDELNEKGFKFSLNSLQYILGGKTKRTRQVVHETLESYLKGEDFKKLLLRTEDKYSSRKGRPSLSYQVLEAFRKFHQAKGEEQNVAHENFLRVRVELIKTRWERRFHKKPGRRSPTWKSPNDLYENPSPEEYPTTGEMPGDLSSAPEVQIQLDRLVS